MASSKQQPLPVFHRTFEKARVKQSPFVFEMVLCPQLVVELPHAFWFSSSDTRERSRQASVHHKPVLAGIRCAHLLFQLGLL